MTDKRIAGLAWLALVLALAACSDSDNKQSATGAHPLEDQAAALKKAQQVENIVQDAAKQPQRNADQE